MANPTLADVIEIIAKHLNFSDPGEQDTIREYIDAEREADNETFAANADETPETPETGTETAKTATPAKLAATGKSGNAAK